MNAQCQNISSEVRTRHWHTHSIIHRKCWLHILKTKQKKQKKCQRESKQQKSLMVDAWERIRKDVWSVKTQHFLGANSELEVQFNQECLGCQFCDVNKAVYSSGNTLRQSQEGLLPLKGLLMLKWKVVTNLSLFLPVECTILVFLELTGWKIAIYSKVQLQILT